MIHARTVTVRDGSVRRRRYRRRRWMPTRSRARRTGSTRPRPAASSRRSSTRRSSGPASRSRRSPRLRPSSSRRCRAASATRSRTACASRSLPGRAGNLAEVRGLMNQLIRRLERVEGDLLAERHARVDDLALLVDLVSVRLARRRAAPRAHRGRALTRRRIAVVYRIDRQALLGVGSAAGSTSSNRLPRPGSLSSSIRPPSATASSRAIARPSPVPPPSRDQNGRKIRSRSSR